MHFKLFDPATGEVMAMQERLNFSPNYHQGSTDAPLPFTLQSTGIGDVTDNTLFEVSPNPFRNETVCRFVLPHAQEIFMTISDMNGVEVTSIQASGQAGQNSITWNAVSHGGAQLSTGVYIIRLKTEQGIMTRKVVLQR